MRFKPTTRRLSVATITAAAVLFAASPSIAGADRVRSDARLHVYDGANDVMPASARARVQAVYNAAGDTLVTLHVWGLARNREYGAHAHTNDCGMNPRDAGPHYQNTVNPDSENPYDPRYVNPRNEIWLDFVTDAEGNAVAHTKLGWQFEPQRRPLSVMIHAERTKAGGLDGDAGSAGDRLACLPVVF